MTDNPALQAARAEKSIAQEMIDVLNDSRKFVAKCAADHKGDGTQIAFFASRQCDRITSAIEKLEGYDEAVSSLMAQAVAAVNHHQELVEALQSIYQCGSIKEAERIAEAALAKAEGGK